MSKYLDPKYWQSENFVEEPELHPARKLTDGELSRRQGISMTSQFKYETDADYKQIKVDAALKTAEIKRKIPVEDYLDITLEFWNTDSQRKSHIHALNKIAKRYGVKDNVIEKIVINFYEHMSLDEHKKLVDAYKTKYPSQRSNSLKDFHANMTAEQKAKKDLNISIAQDPVDEQTAIAIYNEGRLQRTRVAYQSIAKKHLNKKGKKIPWTKVRDIVNGHHYATKQFDIEADIKEYNKIAYGTYKFVSEHGEVFEFDDKTECGKWMLEMQFGKDSDRDPLRELALFDKTTPNEPYTCIRRFWKKWTITNYK